MVPSKPCKHCRSTAHFSFQCFYRPRASKPCKFCLSPDHLSWQCAKNPNRFEQTKKKLKSGKAALKWIATRKAWFRENKRRYYTCYICELTLIRAETTLDHVQPRGSHPELRYESSNLEPCCGLCQTRKGSRSLLAYLDERKANGEHVSGYAWRLVADWCREPV